MSRLLDDFIYRTSLLTVVRGKCRYDRHESVRLVDELAAVSQELGLYDERTCPRCAHRIHSGCPDCQPAPTAREIPADEEGR